MVDIGATALFLVDVDQTALFQPVDGRRSSTSILQPFWSPPTWVLFSLDEICYLPIFLLRMGNFFQDYKFAMLKSNLFSIY